MKPVKNTSQSWKGKWISSNHAIVSEEPEFTLAEMFSGKTTKQKPVDERLHPVVYFKKIFSIQKPVKKASLELLPREFIWLTLMVEKLRRKFLLLIIRIIMNFYSIKLMMSRIN